MINEERVKHMTKIAIFEKERGPEYQPMLNYTKKDYVALHGWGGFLAGTIFFWAIYVLAIVYFMGEVIQNLSTMYLMLMALIGLLCYAAYIIIHVANTRRYAKKQYKKGKKLIKELSAQYESLIKLYEGEEWAAKPKQVRESEKIEEEEDL